MTLKLLRIILTTSAIAACHYKVFLMYSVVTFGRDLDLSIPNISTCSSSSTILWLTTHDKVDHYAGSSVFQLHITRVVRAVVKSVGFCFWEETRDLEFETCSMSEYLLVVFKWASSMKKDAMASSVIIVKYWYERRTSLLDYRCSIWAR